MVERVRLGIVGAGRIAVEHLEPLQGLNGAQVVGLTSRTKARAQVLADRFAVPLVADDLPRLMEAACPDGLLILVSVDQVYDVTCAALNYGVPLFVEKPAGLMPGETWRLARLARERGVRSMVGYNRRYYSIFHKGLEIIQQRGPLMGVMIEGHERIASIRNTRYDKNSWTPNLSEHVLAAWQYVMSTHTIDLLRFFGGEVRDVFSIAHRYQEARGDQFAAVMNFESGAMGEYISHWLSPGGWRVVLYGHRVTVEFKPLEAGCWTDAKFHTHEIEPDPEDIQYKPGFYRQMLAFCDLVRGEAPMWPVPDLDDAYRTMRLAEQIAAPVENRPLWDGCAEYPWEAAL